jgi:O-antigen ligase/tetratricopeptide (TPR) repeat protein
MSRAAALELVAILAGLALFGYVGWDGALWDARFQLVLHLAPALTLAALATLVVRRRLELPRTALELPILALLGAFAVATLLAENHGLAVRALASIVATAAMLPVAMLLLRHRPAGVALVAIPPILLLSAGTLVVMLWRRAGWLLAGAPGLPPIRLANEGTPFGSVAVPPFVIMAVLPLTFLIAEPRIRRWLQLALLAVGVPLALLSGSRSAWLAIAVAAAILAGPMLRGVRRPRRLTVRGVALVVAGLAVALATLILLAPRLTAFTSVIYRSYLWRDTIDAWSRSPLTGIGPGTMPYARQAAAPPLSFPVRQPHSHDVALGVLGDAGLLGLAALLVLIVVFVLVAAPWRPRQQTVAGRTAFAVLGGFLAASLFEDLTFLPAFNLLVLVLAALVLRDAGAIRWERPRPPVRLRLPLGAAGAFAAGLMVVVMLSGDAAAIDYRFGADAAGSRDWAASRDWFMRSAQLDPWHPATPKALAVAADMAGDTALARNAAARAVELNPGDGLSWTNLAILCLERGERHCADEAGQQAVETASLGGPELANAALVYEQLGETAAADAAYRRSLLTNFLTGLTIPWPRHVDPGDQIPAEVDPAAGEMNLVVAHALTGDPLPPAALTDPVARALAAGIIDDRTAANAAIEEALAADRESTTAWDVAIVLRHHWGEPTDRLEAADEVLRGSGLSTERPTVGDLSYDIASFRIYPRDGLVSAAARLIGDRPWPWVLEQLLPPQ